MKIPKNLKIGGFNIDIELVDDLVLERDSWGEYQPKTQTIKIDRSLTNDRKGETLIHEILEAITSIYDVKFEHRDLSIVATVLHQIFSDNMITFKG